MLTVVLLLASVKALATEIWLSGPAPSTFIEPEKWEKSDFQSLFQPGAQWTRAASAIQVFKVYWQFPDNRSEAELRTAFADLRRRHIALAMEAELMTVGGECNGHGEGYGRPRQAARLAERIRQAGGDLRYIAMDEPLWFGHHVSRPGACQRTIDAVARDVAANVAAVKRVFPAVQVGDIEPFGSAEAPGWTDDIMQWAAAFRDATGAPLAFFDVDVAWTGPWRRQMPQLVSRLHAAGIKFGIIYDGNPSDQTGLDWTRHAEENFVAVESGLGLTPDRAILQTWMAQPTQMLPESQPGTMTWLVDRYIATPTRLALHRVGDRLEGKLTDDLGHPLVNVPVSLSAMMLGEWRTPAVHTRSGLVPPNAVSAVLALRINAECGCSGPADIGVGPMRYRDDRTGQTVQRAFRSSPAPGGAVALARFRAVAGQAITQNTPRFAVAADDPFTIQAPLRTDVTSADSGYVALIFLDARGREVLRIRIPFSAAMTPIGRVNTDANGRFGLLPKSEILRTASGFRVEFSGMSQYRMAGRVTER